MPTKHCCNQTSKGVKSSVYPQGKEDIGGTEYQVNNSNYLAFIDQAGTPIIYFGANHLPCGTAQVNLNPIV